MAAVRPSFVLSLAAVLVLLPGCAYLGYLAGVRVGYIYQQSKPVPGLTKQEVADARKLGQTLFSIETSKVLTRNEASLPASILSLQKIRRTAPPELWPIIDLRIAEDLATRARLEEQARKFSEAAEHRRVAQELLRSLGWQDVSEGAVNIVADRELHSIEWGMWKKK
jgi:hypothetical protein